MFVKSHCASGGGGDDCGYDDGYDDAPELFQSYSNHVSPSLLQKVTKNTRF